MLSLICERFSGSSIILIISQFSQKTAFKLTVKCDLTFGLLRCGFPADTIDVDLKVHMLKGINAYQDYKRQIILYRPQGTEVQPYPSFGRKMTEFLNRKKKQNEHSLCCRPTKHKIPRKARRNLITLIPAQSRKKL